MPIKNILLVYWLAGWLTDKTTVTNLFFAYYDYVPVQIRASILQSNPRFDFVGVVDVDVDRATALAEMYGVNTM